MPATLAQRRVALGQQVGIGFIKRHDAVVLRQVDAAALQRAEKAAAFDLERAGHQELAEHAVQPRIARGKRQGAQLHARAIDQARAARAGFSAKQRQPGLVPQALAKLADHGFRAADIAGNGRADEQQVQWVLMRWALVAV